jgi:phosphoglucomutase
VALADLLKEKYSEPAVVIGYDNRCKNSYYSQILAEILSSRAVKVHLFQLLTPNPLVPIAVTYLNCQIGLMLTGGKSPAEYNGIKFINSKGYSFSIKEGEQFMHMLNSTGYPAANFTANNQYINFVPEEVEEKYVSKIINHFLFNDKEKDLKVCYSSWFGAGAVFVPELLDRVGYINNSEIEDHLIPSPDFNNHIADPSYVPALIETYDEAAACKADVVFATSSDCSNAAVAALKDGEYRQLNGQQLAILVVDFLLYAVKTGPEIGARKQKVAISYTLSPYVKAKVMAEGFEVVEYNEIQLQNNADEYLFAIDENCTILMPEISTADDGCLFSLILLNIANNAKAEKKSLWDVLNGIFLEDGLYIDEIDEIYYTELDSERIIERKLEHIISNPPNVISNLISVRKIINHKEGSILYPLTTEVDIINPSDEELYEFLLSDGCKIFIRPFKEIGILRYYVSLHQLVEKPENIQKQELILRQKANYLIHFFQNY